MKKLSFTATGDAILMTRLNENYAAFKPLRDFICRGDVRVNNLEYVISDYKRFGSTFCGGLWQTARPNVFEDMHKFGFNMYSCATNHSMDYSFEGVLQTCRYLESRDICYAGIGENLFEAEKPALLYTGQSTVALISNCSSFDDSARAGYPSNEIPGRPGLNPLRFTTINHVTHEEMETLKKIEAECFAAATEKNSQIDGFTPMGPKGLYDFGGNYFIEDTRSYRETVVSPYDLDRTVRGIRDALNYADHVIIMTHTHQFKAFEFTEPDYFFEDFARKCIDAGASAVIAGGTHQLKPMEIYKGKPIFYSLGNFIFQLDYIERQPIDYWERHSLSREDYPSNYAVMAVRDQTCQRGLTNSFLNYRSVIPYFEFDEDGNLSKLVMKPIELGFDGDPLFKGIPFEADRETSEEICERLQRLSSPYGVSLFLNDEGLIEVRL